MLDIDSLRLTDEERWAVFKHEGIAPDKTTDHAIADAQLAKALSGIQAWLGQEVMVHMSSKTSSEYLQDQLLAAGMTRPEGE